MSTLEQKNRGASLSEKADCLSRIENVSHGFFGCRGGTSPPPWRGLNIGYDIGDAPARVDENLARVRFQIGVTRHHLFTAKQVHGTGVIEVGRDDHVEEVAQTPADAIFTTCPGVGVGVRTADCVPILLASTSGNFAMAIHAGWRGIVSGIIQTSIECAVRQGQSPEQLRAAIGPCISASHFEVGPDVVRGLEAMNLNIEHCIRDGKGDRSFVDLRAVCEAALVSVGVSHIDQIDRCTYAEPDAYFSHRREEGKTGRQISCIALVAPPVLDPDQYT